MNTATIHIDAKGAIARRHCNHDDGSVSIAVTPSSDDITVYITGTPNELMDFASALVVQAHLLVQERKEQA